MVNIDHVATLREARRTFYPDPVHAVPICEMAGADGIIVHLREDRRHIKDRDLRLLREVVHTKLNLEMAATEEMVKIAKDVRPDMVTLVPERREELTTEGGLDVFSLLEKIRPVVEDLKESGIVVSLFVDPEERQIEAARRALSDMVEIHTGLFSEARSEVSRKKELEKIVNAAKRAKDLDFSVNAGHGLHYHNVKEVASIPYIDELSIGHSIIARAVFVGLERAVKEMVALVKGARSA